MKTEESIYSYSVFCSVRRTQLNSTRALQYSRYAAVYQFSQRQVTILPRQKILNSSFIRGFSEIHMKKNTNFESYSSKAFRTPTKESVGPDSQIVQLSLNYVKQNRLKDYQLL